MIKIHYGFFRAKNIGEIEAHSRESYEQYYKKI